ncbi:hypothetical protein TKK_0008001 [Trichogramma kaykai]
MALNSDVADEEASLVYLKYGFDGTNSRSYQQIAKYSAAYSNSLFCTSLLPLQLVDKYTCIVYWSNPRPSSTRFCRPIKIAHEKETPETARNEEQDLQQQIEDLTDFKYKSCLISFEMHLTMIDGKVCNALTETPSFNVLRVFEDDFQFQ